MQNFIEIYVTFADVIFNFLRWNKIYSNFNGWNPKLFLVPMRLFIADKFLCYLPVMLSFSLKRWKNNKKNYLRFYLSLLTNKRVHWRYSRPFEIEIFLWFYFLFVWKSFLKQFLAVTLIELLSYLFSFLLLSKLFSFVAFKKRLMCAIMGVLKMLIISVS